MATITFSGLATGIDSASIISQLMQVARQAEAPMQSQQATDQNKISEFNKIESALTNLQNVVQGFTAPEGFSSMQATSSNSSGITISANGTASTGTHVVQVTSLATNYRQVSTGVADSTQASFGTGSFTISDGVNGDTPVTVKITQGQNSLQGIASAINASGANVTASIVNDGSKYRLVITGNDTKTYSLDFGNLLDSDGVTVNAPSLLDNTSPTYQAGAPAQFTVDGIPMTSSSNTVSNAVQGLTFNLLSQGAASTISVTNDTSSVTKKINSFISAYNSAISLVNSESAYNTTTKTSGTLGGDMTVQTIQNQLQSLLTNIVPGSSSIRTLGDLGITVDEQTGTLSLKSSTLSSALSSHYNDVVNLFSRNGDSIVTLPNTQYGIAQQFNTMIQSMVSPYVEGYSKSGSIEIAKHALNTNISDISDHISDMEQRFTQMQTNLQNQFNAMELTVSKLQSQGNTLLSYLNSMSSSSSSSK